METHQFKARGLFEALSKAVTEHLCAAGFTVVGKFEVRSEGRVPQSKYEIIVVDLPRMSAQMITPGPRDGTILPSCVSLIETYPGEIDIVVANPMEQFAGSNTQRHRLAKEITDLLCNTLKQFEREATVIPDLVTSWE